MESVEFSGPNGPSFKECILIGYNDRESGNRVNPFGTFGEQSEGWVLGYYMHAVNHLQVIYSPLMH